MRAYTLEIEVLVEFEGGPDGFWSKGHHDPAAFAAAVRAYDPEAGELDVRAVRHVYWRVVPYCMGDGEYQHMLREADGPDRGVFPATVYDTEGRVAATIREMDARDAATPAAEDGEPWGDEDWTDYVVAIQTATGEVVDVWRGEEYRAYDDRTVEQYQVSMARGPEDAKARALAIRDQLARARANILTDEGSSA